MQEQKLSRVTPQLDMLRAMAHSRAHGGMTGSQSFGRITVAYYPVCRRYAWWVDDDRATMSAAADVLLGLR